MEIFKEVMKLNYNNLFNKLCKCINSIIKLNCINKIFVITIYKIRITQVVYLVMIAAEWLFLMNIIMMFLMQLSIKTSNTLSSKEIIQEEEVLQYKDQSVTKHNKAYIKV